jgi:hypothetical protein
MGVLTDQMEALANGILATTRERAVATARVRESTARILGQARARLSEIRVSRREMSQNLARDLSEAAGTMAARVGALLGEFHEAHAQRTSELGTFLARHKEARTGELQDLFEELGRAREEIRGLVTQIHIGMSDFVRAARAARGEAAEELRGRTHDRLVTLAQDTLGYLTRCKHAHRDMAERLHGMLSQSHQATRDEVGALLAGFRAARQRIADDLRAAARLWADFASGKAGTAQKPPPGTGFIKRGKPHKT